MKTSKIILSVVGILVLTTAMVEECDAQRRGFGGRGGGFGRGQQEVTEMSLLNIKEVMQHLKEDFGLDEETHKKVSELTADFNDEMEANRRDAMQDFRDMDDDERQKAFADMRKSLKEMSSSYFKKIKKMLDKKQLKRLTELKMQRMGTALLHDGLFQEMLELSAEQTEQLNSLKEEFDKGRQKMLDDMRSQMRSGGGDREAMREVMMDMQDMMTDKREKYAKETLGVLSDEQRKKLEDIKGKKFKFPTRQRRQRDT